MFWELSELTRFRDWNTHVFRAIWREMTDRFPEVSRENRDEAAKFQDGRQNVITRFQVGGETSRHNRPAIRWHRFCGGCLRHSMSCLPRPKTTRTAEQTTAFERDIDFFADLQIIQVQKLQGGVDPADGTDNSLQDLVPICNRAERDVSAALPDGCYGVDPNFIF